MNTIVNATKQDLKRIASCHQRAFPDALSSAMGLTYLLKMLEWYLVDNRAFMFFLEKDGNCIAYCGGLKVDGKVPMGSASSMMQHSFNEALKAFVLKPWLLLHPEFIRKYKLVFRNIWRRLTLKKLPEMSPAKAPGVVSHAGLIVIGVDPTYQGKGYGTMLLQEFEKISQKMGFNRLQLTVRTNNSQAIRSYVKNGWYITSVNGPSTSMAKEIIL